MTKRLLAALLCCLLLITSALAWAQETTPEATTDATDAVVERTPEATDTLVVPGYARVRVGHYGVEIGSLDVYIDGVLTHEAVPPGAISNYVPVSAAFAGVTAAESGGGVSSGVLPTINALLNGDSLYTLVITPNAVLVIDDSAVIAAGMIQRAQVVIVNALIDAQISANFYNVEVLTPLDGGAIENVAAGAFATSSVSPTNALLTWSVQPDDGDASERENTLSLRPDLVYLIAVYGTTDDPQIALTESGTQSIAEILRESTDFSLLYAMIEAANRVETLDQDSPFTLFAPSNAAIARYLTEQGLYTDQLLLDSTLLQALLDQHVTRGLLFSDDVASLARIPMLSGDDIIVSTAEGLVLLNPIADSGDGTRLLITDVFATNGLIHVVDRVLIPPVETP